MQQSRVTATRPPAQLTANRPTTAPVATRWATARARSPAATTIAAASAPRWMCAVPQGLQPRRREDHRGVGDVLDDAGRGRAGGNRLQRKQITVDHSDGVQAGVQAERRATDRAPGSAGTPRRASVSRVGRRWTPREPPALHRGQDLAQRQLRGQCHLGDPAVGQNGDAHDRHTAPDVTGRSKVLGPWLLLLFHLLFRLASLGREVAGQPLARRTIGRPAIVAVSCSIATRDREGCAGREGRHPLAVEGARRAHQHTARGGVDDAHPDLGGGVLPVAVAARDDLDVAARAGEHRLHHRSRRLPGYPGSQGLRRAARRRAVVRRPGLRPGSAC